MDLASLFVFGGRTVHGRVRRGDLQGVGPSARCADWDAVTVGLYFGIFQAVMPLIGYLLGSTFAELISSVDHWVAFVLLGLIGGQYGPGEPGPGRGNTVTPPSASGI